MEENTLIRVLLVEDNPDDAELIQASLEDIPGLRLTVEHTDRLASALQRLPHAGFDVMLLDLSLPDSQGLSTVEKVRLRAPNLPIIILTGLNDHTLAFEGARHGAHDYLVKGDVSGEILSRSMRYAIERGRVEKELRAHRDHLEDLVERRTIDLRRNAESLKQEIAQRIEAEGRLRLLAAAVENAADAILITDPGGRVEYANPAFVQLIGFTEEELRATGTGALKSEEHQKQCFEAQFRSIDSGGLWRGELICQRKSGALVTCDASIASILNTSGKVCNYVAVYRDVTEQNLLLERLNRAQRLESIGQLAGGIAHDFNNILQAILGYASLNAKELPPGSELASNNQEVAFAATRAAELTKQLLAFGRRQVLERTPVNLNEVVRPLINLLRRLVREDIELDLVPGHKLGTVEADPGQLEQVLVNLCVNARDAMPKGGRITIETENLLLNGNYTESHPWARPGRFVLMCVTDNGEGMPPEVLDKIFEPFFTTKPEGAGTGLGLATVYGIVKQHDGFIHCYSEVGKGTSFKIYLPMSSRQADAVSPQLDGPMRGGDESILVIEDDQGIRLLVSRLLQKAGYAVTLATNGEEALHHIDGGLKADLVLSDIVMPKMGGMEFLQHFRDRGNTAPVLLASGYSSRAITPELTLRGEVAIVQKPYSPDDLLRKVRSMLDGG